MLRTGIIAKCDRCGKIEHFVDGPMIPSSVLYSSSGWGNIGNKELCPCCYDEYLERRHKMENEFWE